MMDALNQARDLAFAYCDAPEHAPRDFSGGIKAVRAASVAINTPKPFGTQQNDWSVVAVWDRAEAKWHTKWDRTAQVIRDYDVQTALQAARGKQAAEQAQRIEEEARQKEKSKQSALADCGANPVIIGGPWFSSTYKIGAEDEVRRRVGEEFLCVKSVEYVSPAVNPAGGQAARATFTGYDNRSYSLTKFNIDFPY
jgi:hypothetical protein